MKDIRTLVLSRPGYEGVIEQIIIETEEQPEEQTAFITFLFDAMSVEGCADVTDLRDAAFTIFTHPKFQPILESNSEFILSTYTQSVRTQNMENDPYSGSIATLLEVGKVISTILRPVNRDLDGIIRAWEKVSDDMPEAEDRKWINIAVEEIEHPDELDGPRPSTVEIDNRVLALSKQKLSLNTIAWRLHVPVSTIHNSRSRLRRAGRIEPTKRGRLRKEQP